ncbi:MAG: ABC transporter permease [Flavobacteriales bacterium]
MSKTGLIIKREYWTRVRKPSFIIMSILGPLLIASTFIIPLLIKATNFKEVHVQVVDASGFGDYLPKYSSKYVTYHLDHKGENIDNIAARYHHSEDTVVLWIREKFMQSPAVEIRHKDHPGLNVMTQIKNDLQDLRIKAATIQSTNVNLSEIEGLLTPVNVSYFNEGTSLEVKMFVGLASGLLMYILIMLYGVQVMRGIMEEKTNRIVEVIISSVKPLQLLYGKIIGIALAGLTQFVILISLLLVLIGSSKSLFMESAIDKAHDQVSVLQGQGQITMKADAPERIKESSFSEEELDQYLDDLGGIAPRMLLLFPLFFIGGYLLYSSFYAAIGAAVDSETETQQFVLPVTIPIIAGILIATNIFENPHGDLAFWSSMIPLTSPIVMLARLPFMDLTTQWWEVLLSLTILYITFVFTTKLAAKIYRTGILMYGQKASYRSILKWLRYKN